MCLHQGSYRSGKTGKSQGILAVRENVFVKVRENEKLMPPDV